MVETNNDVISFRAVPFCSMWYELIEDEGQQQFQLNHRACELEPVKCDDGSDDDSSDTCDDDSPGYCFKIPDDIVFRFELTQESSILVSNFRQTIHRLVGPHLEPDVMTVASMCRPETASVLLKHEHRLMHYINVYDRN